MVISHKYKFITVDIPKTGTRSLRETFSKSGLVYVVGKPPNSDDILKQHANILDIEKGFVENGWPGFDDYYKYSVVRNPWDRYFSFLTYYKTKEGEYSIDAEYLNESAKKQVEMAVDLFKGRSYAEVLKIIIEYNPPHSYFLLNEDNDCKFDRISLFEDLNLGFDSFCVDVGISTLPLMHSNKSSARIAKEEAYTQEIIDVVAEKEKWVIDKFNYDFNIY